MSHNYFIGQSGRLIAFNSHKTPEFKEQQSVDWVLYGSDDEWKNRYPDYSIHNYNSSPKNNTIINKKCEYTIGQGLTYDSIGLDLPRKIEAKTFIHKIKDNDCFPRSVKDRAIHGGFANEMIYNKKGDKVMPYHVDFSYIRISKPKWNEKEMKYEDPIFYYTSNWNVRKPQENKDWTIFQMFKWDESPEPSKRYLYYYKDYRPSLGVYPLPEYVACVPYISADFEIANFTYNNVKNGATAGYLVNFFNGEPSEVQKRNITEMYRNTFHGTDNAGKSLLSFNESKDSGVEVTPINPNGQDDRFTNLNNSIRDEIYTGHGVDPVVVGLKGDNGFNNNADEKRTAVNEWQNSYVDTVQGVFEDYFTDVMNFNGIVGKVKILKKQPVSKPLSEAILTQISTIEELREMAGLGKSKVEPNPVNDSLTQLSPLVQNKILDSMSLEEIRSLISLKTLSPIDKAEVKTTQTMAKDDQLLRMFVNSGIFDDECELIDKREIPIFSTKDAFKKGNEFKDMFVNQTEINALKLLIGETPEAEIKSLLQITTDEYNEILRSLQEQKLLNDELLATNKGKREAKKSEVFVVYKYVKRSDVDGPAIIETTRPFCKNLIRLSANKSWRLEDIQAMNNDMPTDSIASDVFTSRGGWRTIEGTNIHVPFCRHVWEQRLVRSI
jgi:hypothetical protein